MANFNVNLHPNLVNLGTEGGLDSSVINSKSLQRTMNGLMIMTNGERKIVGNLADEQQFNNIIADVSDYQNIEGGTGPTWGAVFGQDTESEDYFYAQSADVDVDGNVYYASINPASPSDAQSTIRKFDSEGNVLWEQSVSEISSAYEFVRARMASDGGIFLIYRRMIRKLDSDGNELWKFTQDEEMWNTFWFVGCAEDSSGNLFVAGKGVYEGAMFFVAKFDSTGSLLEERQIYVSSAEYMAADIVIDSNDNVILPLNIDIPEGGWSTLVVKLPNNLSEHVWYVVLSADYGYGGEDADSYALGIDSSDNVYVLGYFQFLTKINSSGEIVWSRDIAARAMGVDSDGNCYMVADEGEGTTIQITKIDTSGELVWSYSVDYTSAENLRIRGFSSEANSGAFVNNNHLIVMAEVELPSNVDLELVLKLPLEPISGTFGNFVFTDNTENIDLVVMNPTDNSENSTFDMYETAVLTNVVQSLSEATVTQEITITSFGG